MLIAIVPILVLLAGLLMWGLAKSPKVVQLGWLMIQVGLVISVWVYRGYTKQLF